METARNHLGSTPTWCRLERVDDANGEQATRTVPTSIAAAPWLSGEAVGSRS